MSAAQESDAPGAALTPPSTPEAPVVYVHQLGWGECDPARIAYTGVLPQIALRAVETWWRAVLGAGWYELNLDHGMGTPFVRLALDFRAPVTPRAPLDCAVHVARLGTTSIAHRVRARQGETLCFEVEAVAVCVGYESFAKSPLPPQARAAIEAYIARHPAPPAEENAP